MNICFVPIPYPLLVLSHIKFGLCYIGSVPFPINIGLLFNVVEPVPPKETGKVPDATFGALIAFFKAKAFKSIVTLFETSSN